MKLKFINLLLAAFLLIGSAQALTSCKDTDEDLYAQLRDDNLTLQKKFEADLNVLKSQISALETLTGALQTQINGLETKLGEYAKKSDLDEYVKKAEFNDLVDKYITAVSTYKNLKEVLDALKATQDEVNDAHGNFESIGARFVAIEGRLAALETTLENYATLVSDVETLKNFMTTTTTDITNINGALNTLNTFMNDWTPKLGTIEQNAANALALAQKNEADVAALTATYQQLQQLIINNQTATDAQIQALQTKLGDLEQKMQTILDDYTTKADVDQAIADAIAGLATNDALETLAAALRQEAQANLDAVELRLQQQIITTINRLNGLDTKVADLQQQIDALDTRITNFINNYQGDLSAIQGDLSALQQDVQNQLGTINGDIAQQTLDIAQNAADIITNTLAIEALQKSLDSVIVRLFNLENRITSIELQGTENPVFGYLKTPFGFESNVLMNHMGENLTGFAIEFPNFVIEGEEYDGRLIITDDDIRILGSNINGFVTYNNGATLFNEADGNLGTIYLTLNPANIDLAGKTFNVVTSSGKVMPIELKNLRPSTKELTHGYSRTTRTSPNGFYEADVTVANGDVPALRVVVDQGLKASAKKLLSDLRDRKISGSAIASLGNALYEQFNGFLPALGIRAAWQESDGAATPTIKEQSVYSRYALAAATFNPLSYKFLYGTSFRGIKIPDLSGILDDYKFNFSDKGLNIEFRPITISGVDVNFQLNIQPELGELNLGTVGTSTTVEITNYPTGVVVDEDDPDNSSIVSRYSDVAGQPGYREGANGTATKVIDVNVDIDLDESDLASNLSSSIESALEGALSGIDGQINSQLQEVINTLIGQIQGQVNDMMSSLENQVNTSLSDILGSLQDQVNGKIDMVGDKINAITSRLDGIVKRFNGILSDPNHYLQPTLLYSMKGESFGMFSTSKAFPSQFTGSGNAVMLVPTTYTAETVTPAFKKFIAVTNVYKSNDYRVNAQAGDAKCKQLADAANAQPYMNEVVAGERRTIPFSYEGGKGYTYEIVYQALDYSGYTSTAKYYVSIK